MREIRLALAQINTTVGDFKGNYQKIVGALEHAKSIGAEIVAFPELTITGYPPEDLLLKPEFITENLEYLQRILEHTENMTAVVGYVDRTDDIFNAAAIIHNKKIAATYHKIFLPNYGVFDENRYFQAGQTTPVFSANNIKFAVNICEDIWYPGAPLREQTLFGGAELVINISSSPYHFGKARDREKMLSVRASDNNVYLAYVNLVGGQDELVFDGNSMVFSADGKLLCKAAAFKEELLTITIRPEDVFRKRLHDPRRRKEKYFNIRNESLPLTELAPLSKPKKAEFFQSPVAPFSEEIAEVYAALVTGLRDYVFKNGFRKVVIGISGGIDSALVAAVAVDALGAENVAGVSMPSDYTSAESREDARVLAKNLGFELVEIPIKNLYENFISELAPIFKDLPADTTEENIQARTRGNIIMSLSNKFGWLVLATGNKSEVSVGYCTLYGDMVGGFAVIKDVPKVLVYKLCAHRNESAGFDIIPGRIISKAPSAELRPDQKDTDSLPDYEILDPILKYYVEGDFSVDEIVQMGYAADIVKKVVTLVDRNEYKRRQAAPGIKITYRAFGKDRRFPITNGFKC